MIQRIHHKIALRALFLLIVLLQANPAFSQATIGAKEQSMGLTGVALPNSSFAIFSNPALLRDQRNSFSLYALRFSGFSELTDIAAAGSAAFSWGTAGLGLHRFGFELFNETRLHLAYKNSFEQFFYGVALNYSTINQGDEYGSASAFGINAGIAAEIIPDLWIAARATNINQPVYGNSQEELPRDLALGFSIRPAPVVLYTLDVVKDVQFPASVRSGIEVQPVPRFFGRAGFTTEPTTYTFGFGYEPEHFRFNIAVQQHDVLGISPSVDMQIAF